MAGCGAYALPILVSILILFCDYALIML